MDEFTKRGYFDPQQAQEVAAVFAAHGVEYMFIGKGGAILLGYPAATQDVDVFPKRDPENGRRIVTALRQLDFQIPDEVAREIVRGADFVQLKNGPFDLDLVFAPDGISSFEAARERMVQVGEFPVASIRDIIASKRAAARAKDAADLPLLEAFRQEYEQKTRGELRTAKEIAMEKTETKKSFVR